ncbi:ATP-binding protein [Muriicola sp.]|uniref:sensor histidine kinase n=1 Tax=Muriicola sp. TaxID=2020856 RepID=UPI003C72129F
MLQKGSILTFLFLILVDFSGLAQDSVLLLKPAQLENGWVRLSNVEEWKFQKGTDPSWATTELDDSSWTALDSAGIQALNYDENGNFEGWFRFRFKFEEGFTDQPFFLYSSNYAAQEIYLDGEPVHTFGNPGIGEETYKRNDFQFAYLSLKIGQEYNIAIHFVDRVGFITRVLNNPKVMGQRGFLWFATGPRVHLIQQERAEDKTLYVFIFSFLLGLSLLFWLIWLQNRKEQHLFLIAIFMTLLTWVPLNNLIYNSNFEFSFINKNWYGILPLMQVIMGGGSAATLPLVLASTLQGNIPKWVRRVSQTIFFILAPLEIIRAALELPFGQVIAITAIMLSCLVSFYLLFKFRKKAGGAKRAVIIGLGLFAFSYIILFILMSLGVTGISNYWFGLQTLIFPVFLLIYVALWLKETLLKEREKAEEVIKVTREKENLLKDQNIQLEREVAKRTEELNNSLENLKATQTQLIQSEKMASLGELTAGIAHEIQNPLNFVNNFSEVSNELIDEMNEEIERKDFEEVKAIAKDIKQNLEKINHHGKRADSIVKGMLQHSRSSSGEKEPTDLNALADEYLRLAYHGLRAKDKSFNVTLETHFDETIGKVNLVSQDIGRVILNLITNAFYVVQKKKEQHPEDYEPTVTVSTKKTKNGVKISVKDNGNGIPEGIKEKIFQPFFTTKPTGQGTGLGLSMSYDIVTKGHGGNLKVETEEGKGTTFYINLPVSK